jgi:competence protein ComEC
LRTADQQWNTDRAAGRRQVYERYGALGVERLRTDEAGALALEVGTAVAWRAYRTAHARYWYGR